MKTLLTIICAAGLAAMTAFAKKSPTPSPTPTPASEAAATGSEATGKITEFAAGASIDVDTGAGAPVHYKLGKNITYVNARGKIVKASKMKKDRKVRVHFVKQGIDMVVDKITVVKD